MSLGTTKQPHRLVYNRSLQRSSLDSNPSARLAPSPFFVQTYDDLLSFATNPQPSRATNRHFTRTAVPRVENEAEFAEFDQRMLPADYDPASFSTTDHRAPPTARVWGLVDQVCGLTLAEYNQLSTIMMEKFCYVMLKKLTMKERFEIMARVQSADVEAAAAGKGEKKAGKSTFEVKMESYDVASDFYGPRAGRGQGFGGEDACCS